MARIIGSYPPSAKRAAEAGAVSRFADALKNVLLDDSAASLVASALAQLYTLAIVENPAGPLQILDKLALLLQRYPGSGVGAARAGAAEALPEILRTCPEDPG